MTRTNARYLLLQAGTYTVEAATATAGDTGGYTLRLSWAAADACVEDLGKLSSASSPLSGSGIIAQDAACVSSLRDPKSTDTFYAAPQYVHAGCGGDGDAQPEPRVAGQGDDLSSAH